MKLKQIKTYIIAIRARKTNYNVQGMIWNLIKNSLADVIWRRKEREFRGKIQTIIDTFLDILMLHAPPHVEERMSENHSRRRLGIFWRSMKPQALPETRVSTKTNGASDDAPTVIIGKKNWIITVKPLHNKRVFCHFRWIKSLMHCSIKY